MQGRDQMLEGDIGAVPGGGLPNVLIVDDSRAHRQLLSVYLRRWGYAVTECASAEEALALCAVSPIDIVISDWVMPGMSGVDFCRHFRALPRDGYGYFILLTSKSDKAAIALGLEAGADDFATKPFSADEMRARLRAGTRILSMQAALVEKNRQLRGTLEELRGLYDTLDRDLVEARKLQQTLVRDRLRDFGTARVAMLIRASGHVGGDLVGCFRIDEGRVAIYSVDVSGHGVASAMMTARLAGYLSASPEQNLAFRTRPDGRREILSPAGLMEAFNRLMLDEIQAEQYFTMVYAELVLETGAVRLAQAGHPHPMVIRAGGQVELVGAGGLPVGLIPGASYEDAHLHLAPGDRLFLMSDGITECPGVTGADLDETGVQVMAAGLADLPGPEFLEALVWSLAEHAGTDTFPDDVSGLVLDYFGPG